jgi:hypothetical protein
MATGRRGMSVKIIRPLEYVEYSMELRQVRIEFNDGTHMSGFINLHAKYANDEQEDSTSISYRINDVKFKFRRTSDYLKNCNQNEGMITIFNGSYGGQKDRVCFVFLHSVKFISEEIDEHQEGQIKPQPQSQPEQPAKSTLFLRSRLNRQE